MTPVNFNVGEEEYQLLPHTGFEAMDLDRKVLGLVGKMALNGDLLEDDIYAMAALSTTLSDLGSSDYRWLVETTFRNVTVVTPGKKNVSLSDIDAVAEHFAGHMNDMYTALVGVWKAERLSPFAKAPKEPSGDSTTPTQS